MSNRVERTWAAVLNSPGYRRFLATAPGKALFRSGWVRSAKVGRRRAAGSLAAARHRDDFAGVTTCFLFLGHTKSGGSLLGSMLDAHPSVVCSDELDILEHLEHGFSGRQIMALIARNSRREALKGRVTARRLEAYTLAVPGQWQGRYTNLTAVGDARAGKSTRRLAARPGLLDQLRSAVSPAVVKLIQVVRHPMDPIGAMVARSGKSVEEAIEDYSEQCRRLTTLRAGLAAGELIEVHYEDIVENPERVITDVCHHLGVEPSADYLAACRALVDATPRLDRRRVDWTEEQIDHLARTLTEVDFLSRYQVSR
jgi:hypothetical protein